MIVFVYGTLKKGCSNHTILESMVIEREPINVVTISKYPMFKASNNYFPYLVNKPGEGDYIKGELYEIYDKHEEKLDYFEGVPELYKKGKIDVTDGQTVYKDVNVYYKCCESYYEKQEFINDWNERCTRYHNEILQKDEDEIE